MVITLLFFILFSFSGCSIRKAENNNSNADLKDKIKDVDSDDDRLMDAEEDKLGTDKYKLDTDSDGLSDYDEAKKWNTNPLNNDTDGDGYFDGQEAQNGYDPLGEGQLDSDSDGLGDADEKKIGTDPDKFDTDGDGLNDKEEIDLGRNPLVAE